MIDTPGIYDISAEEYHADCCLEPSLSASVIHILLSQSPRHAWYSHVRLNSEFVAEERDNFDRGTAAHAYLLEGNASLEIIDAPDFRTKAAREARDAARAAGKTPLLAKHWQDVLDMVEAATRQLDEFRDPPRPFTAGKPERTIVWMEPVGSKVVWCRARVDWLADDRLTVDDYKSTAASANPEAWTRTMFGAGADIQAAWYRRGVRAVAGVDPKFRFCVQENFAPFLLSVISLGPMAMDLAEKKVRFALELWARCLSTDEWPAYPQQTCYADLPAYEEARWIAREEASL